MLASYTTLRGTVKSHGHTEPTILPPRPRLFLLQLCSPPSKLPSPPLLSTPSLGSISRYSSLLSFSTKSKIETSNRLRVLLRHSGISDQPTWTFHSFILTIGEGIACILWPPALEKKDGGSGETRWSPYVFHWRGNLDACLGNDWLYLTWITPRADNTRHTRRAVVTSIYNRRETYPSRRKWSEISGQEKGMLGNARRRNGGECVHVTEDLRVR